VSAWWDPRTWVRNLFPVANEPGGFMVREGLELRWDRTRLPVSVYIDRSADPWWHDVTNGVRWVNAVVGRPVLLLPEEPTYMITAAYAASMGKPCAGPPGGVYATCADGVEPDHGRTDVRFAQAGHVDGIFVKRAGEIRNALVELSHLVPEASDQIVRHELCHALGLDHGRGLMARVLDGRGASLTPADVARLREVYA
jgi:hypothetical protein